MKNIIPLILEDLNEKDLAESNKALLEVEKNLQFSLSDVSVSSDTDAIKVKNKIVADFENLTNTVGIHLQHIEEFAHQNVEENLVIQSESENINQLTLQEQLNIIFENTYNHWATFKLGENHAHYNTYDLKLKFISQDNEEEYYETIEQEAANKLYDLFYDFTMSLSEKIPQHCSFKNTILTKSKNKPENEYNMSLLLEAPKTLNPTEVLKENIQFSIISCKKMKRQLK